MMDNNINNDINNKLHKDIMEETKKRYVEINNKYLCEGLAWLGFKYQKFGYGKDTKYSFPDTDLMKQAINKLVILKKELNITY